jgi:glycosyltransferase involved in cell wall biosynthesis
VDSRDRIRVLEIVHGLAVEGPLGGIERFGIELVRAMDRSRVEPILCGLWHYHTPYEDQWLARLREEGIQAFVAADWSEAHPYRDFQQAWRGTLQALADQRLHLVHSHCQFGDVLALLVARRLGAQATVRTVHNEREWPRRPSRRLFLTNILYPLLFRQEIGISQQVTCNLDQRPLARLFRRRSLYLPNAIDLERFSACPNRAARRKKREELGLPADAPVVGTVGRLTVQKGYSFLLEAVPLVLEEMPAARFAIIGEGELAGELEGQARQLGVAHAVRFAGSRRDIEEMMAVMDLFASSSLWEGLPTVILESMAAHLPVVATDVSGTRELVQDGVTGLLVPPGDPPTLANAIVRVFQDPAHARAMAEAAYGRVQDFSIGRVAERHVELYQKLLAPQ